MDHVPREAATALRRLLRAFPAVLVHGPRQCGKSTLVGTLLPDWLRVDLERPSDLGLLESDLEGFFAAHPRRLVIDEAQRLPALFPLLRYVIDRGRGGGRFVLTGSASPSLLRTASETLAGRLGLLELTPFSARELAGVRTTADRWFWGGYPPVHGLRSPRARSEWLDAYVSTFLERELPGLGLRLPATRLRKLWIMLTHVHGSLLNVSDLARSLGVSSHAVSDSLDVLEGTFMIRRLPPRYANVQKRLTKSPKLYVRDTGLLHFLAGLRSPKDLETWPRRAHSFEGLVVEELATLAAHRAVRPEISFWRTHGGAEVDLVIGVGGRLIPVEVKLGRAVSGYDVRGLRECMKDLRLRRGYVVTPGEEHRRIGRDIEIVPWSSIVRGEFDFALPR